MKTWQVDACRRAKARGQKDYYRGVKLRDNPYDKNLRKPYGSPCLVESWEAGWKGASQVHRHCAWWYERGRQEVTSGK